MSNPELIFWNAIEKNDIKLVKYLIQGYDIDIHIKDSKHRNLFYYANSKEMVNLFVELGLDINEQDKVGKTALHHSLTMRKANLLISCGANPDILDIRGQKYDEVIKRREKRERRERYLKNNGTFDCVIEENSNEKEVVISKNKKEKFVNYIQSIEKQIEEKNITINDASRMGDSSLVFSLLMNGADVNERDKDGNTPLHNASTKLIASILIGRGADIYAKNNEGIDVCNIKRDLDPDNEVSKYILNVINSRKEKEL